MELTLDQTISTAVQSTPSQESSTTAFETTFAPDTVPDGSTKDSTTVKPMEVESDTEPKIDDNPSSSSSTATPSASSSPAKHDNANLPKDSPAKSRSKTRPQKQTEPTIDQAILDTKVEVSGYPTYSKPQDLHKMFSSYGTARVEHVGRRFAVIAFESREIARTALADSMQLCLYGQFLAVKPFSGIIDDQKKQVYKSKHAVVTVPPEQIPLDGTFGEQLAALLAAVRLTQEEVTALAALYADLERVMQPIWPGCQAMPFGSITTGLGVKSSDADCFMNIPPKYRYGCYNFVNKAKRILQQYPDLFAEVFAIPRANTPIVKLFHLPTKTHCDLTFKTPLGALNSKLVAFLLHADPRFLPLAVVVKYWASVHGISGSGKLTNYALTLMLIFYLQTRGMLPAVAWLQKDADPIMVDGWNTGFLDNYERLPPSTDNASIQDLLGEFYKFYDTFDFENQVACPYLGRTIEKKHFLEYSLPEEFQRYNQNVANNLVAPLRTKVPVCVQDPFEQCHNVASSVTPRMTEDIRVYIRFAAEFYEKDKANDCKNLLRTILLEKPKLVRVKINPEFRVNLYTKMLNTIIHDDWKETIRKAIYTIFERMLKLKLAPAGEKETTRNGREKEVYVTSMNKPLWKRKQFSRLYEAVQMGFVERHARVTEEILNVERSEWVIEFQVILSFCTKFRSAWVSFRLTNGDVDAFYPFGKYLLSTMQNWVLGVLQAAGDTSMMKNLDKLEELDAADSPAVNSDCDSDSGADDHIVQSKALEESQTALKEAFQGSSVEAPQEVSEEAPQEASEEAPQGASEEALQGASEEAPQRASEEAPQGASAEAPQEASERAPQGASEEAPQGASEEAPQEASERAHQGASEEASQGVSDEVPSTPKEETIQSLTTNSTQSG